MKQFSLNFTGIGAPKAGTTLVADWLSEHPEICFAEPKEPHYFNEISSYIHKQPNPNSQKDLQWYSRHFAHGSTRQINGEFSTGYMYDPNVAQRLFDHNPEIKILVCLRHPAARAYSQYIMFRYYFEKETLPFDDAVQLRKEFIEKSKYYTLLAPYLKIFPKNQLKIILLEDIKENPLKIYREICDFLKIDSNFEPRTLTGKSNSAKAVKAPFVSKLMGYFTKIMVGLRLSFVVEQLKKAGFKDWVMKRNSKSIEYPPMSSFARNYIIKATIKDTEELEILLNRDLSVWKQ